MKINDLVLIARAQRMLASGEARGLREACGLSQAQVAEVCGVATGAVVSRWESGERIPRTMPALRYARLLDRLARARGPVSADVAEVAR